MNTSSRYSILEVLSHSPEKIIYKAMDHDASREVCIKTIAEHSSLTNVVARLKSEFNTLQSMAVTPGIPAPLEVIHFQGNTAIVLEYVNGQRLSESAGNITTVEDFLHFALRLVKAVDQVHKAGVIHTAIEPAHILYNPETGSVGLTGFASAIKGGEQIDLKQLRPDGLNLMYISPEQTGRINRSVDSRSDYYSLGMLFYWVLTGKYPFSEESPLKLVHQHIAGEIVPPDSIKKSIPKALSNIVLKLLSKNPDDRYQSSSGLQHDLEHAFQLLKTSGRISDFELGKKDYSGKFRFPQKLYAREAALNTLQEAVSRMDYPGVELFLIKGKSGSGKSSLVSAIQSFVSEKGALFARGKFERLAQNTPYSGLFHALNDAVSQMLTRPERQLYSVKARILMALGGNASLMIDALPDLELITGKQPAVDELPSVQGQKRFERAILNFIHALAHETSPLVLFLDDLQWTDTATMRIIRLLLENREHQHLLLLGAYRDNEVDNYHPIPLFISELQQAKMEVRLLHVEDLPAEAVQSFLSDLLLLPKEQIIQLSELVMRVTHGNAFFLHQYLRALYEQKLFQFDAASVSWQFDLRKIESLNIPDNVAGFTVDRIKTCSPSTIQLLAKGAAAGRSFDLKTIHAITPFSQKEALEVLWEAVEKGIINPMDFNYQVVREEENEVNLPESTFRFLHDRMHEAAYFMLPEEQLPETHYRIGKHLQSRMKEGAEDTLIFDITDQLNLGAELVKEPSELQELAQLNFRAGVVAMSSHAYQSSYNYFRHTLRLTESGVPHDNLMSLYKNAAESAYLISSFSEAEELFAHALEYAESPLEKAHIYSIQIGLYNNLSKLRDAMRVGLEGLKLLGVTIPKKVTKLTLLKEIIAIKWILGRHGVEKLTELPEMEDEEPQLAQFMMIQLQASAYNEASDLLALLILKSFRLLLKYGNSVTGYSAYSGYAAILGLGFGNYKAAWKLTELGFEQNQQYNSGYFLGRANFAMGSVMINFVKHVQESIPYLNNAYRLGVQNGDYTQASIVTLNLVKALFFKGETLTSVREKSLRYYEFAQKIKYNDLANFHHVILNAIGDLEGEKHDIPGWSDGFVEELESRLESSNYELVRLLHQALQMQIAYTLGDDLRCISIAEKEKPNLEALIGSLMRAEYSFYYGLSLARAYLQSERKKSDYVAALKKEVAFLAKLAKNGQENYQHRHDILCAQLHIIGNKKDEAIKLLGNAITDATKYGFIQNAALAYELLAHLQLDLGLQNEVRQNLISAHQLYHQWGAHRKCAAMEEAYPEYISSVTHSQQRAKANQGGLSSMIDIASVLKASTIISREIEFDKTLKNVMQIIIENAGAERGVLILKERKELMVKAIMEAQSDISLPENLPLREMELIEQSVVNYVHRRQTHLVVHNASENSEYNKNAHIRKHDVKSILCFPLLEKSRLSGIVYLENNKSGGIFTEERIETLTMLSSQIAISLRNAQHYEEMLTLNTAYERFVPKQFLNFLGKESIVDVKLGNQIQREMSIMFSDIRDFTQLSEKLSPQENFNFINDYLGRMEPHISRNNGFVDKYIGDAIMALFPTDADDAVKAAIGIMAELVELNRSREEAIDIGIGINTGNLMLGTVGGARRMDGTVISDAVNITARVEELTKEFDARLIITEHTYAKLSNPESLSVRKLGATEIKGKTSTIGIYEVFDVDSEKQQKMKKESLSQFERAVELFMAEDKEQAASLFKEIHEANPDDRVAARYIQRCAE